MRKHKEVIVDHTLPDPVTGDVRYRVYYWEERPDAAVHAESDKFFWHPDSEHETKVAANKRATELKKGASRQSILKLTALNAATATKN